MYIKELKYKSTKQNTKIKITLKRCGSKDLLKKSQRSFQLLQGHQDSEFAILEL